MDASLQSLAIFFGAATILFLTATPIAVTVVLYQDRKIPTSDAGALIALVLTWPLVFFGGVTVPIFIFIFTIVLIKYLLTVGAILSALTALFFYRRKRDSEWRKWWFAGAIASFICVILAACAHGHLLFPPFHLQCSRGIEQLISSGVC